MCWEVKLKAPLIISVAAPVYICAGKPIIIIVWESEIHKGLTSVSVQLKCNCSISLYFGPHWDEKPIEQRGKQFTSWRVAECDER